MDPETGLLYLRARYYDPSTGQFLTRDPLDALTQSAYGYVDGNPLNEGDPLGLGFWSKLGKIAKGVVSDFNPVSWSRGSILATGIEIAAAGVAGAVAGVAIGATALVAFAVAAPIIIIGLGIAALGAYYTYEDANGRSSASARAISSQLKLASYRGPANGC